MKVIQVYKCFCDEQRLRIINLLREGPLCVCHLVEILNCEQVKVSKQLRYMKSLGMVAAARQAQWMIYRLAEPGHPLLTENLKCLQDCTGEDLRFAADLRKRAAILRRLAKADAPIAGTVGRCCPASKPGGAEIQGKLGAGS